MLTNSEVIEVGTKSREFDLVINCIGYEDRARFAIESGICKARNFVSIAFEDEGLFGYKSTSRLMRDLASSVIAWTAATSERDRIDAVMKAVGSAKKLRLAVDISSMNRTMISSVFRSIALNRDILESATIIYTPAKYKAPEYEYPQIDQIGPVIPELSGYRSEPSFPIGLLIGLGYEFGIAAGIMNRLEPKLTIAFRAVGNGQKYEDAVRAANFDFSFGLSRCEVTDYSLLRPDKAAAYVENILSAMVRQYRCILVPMGPKLLSAIFILAGFHFFGQVAVWRVSEVGKTPRNSTADGRVVLADIDLSRTFGMTLSSEMKSLYEGGI
ncbi:hypothetical protein ACU8NW_29305 (plasmid) [Rhizobium leguminosarum]